MVQALSFSPPAFSLRRELRLALLAAMETCWVYSALVFLALLMQATPLSSPLLLFAAYWVALIVGRELPRRKERWVLLQAAAVLTGIVVLLVIVRIETYAQHDWLDMGWMPLYLRAIFLSEGFGRAIYTTLAVAFVFIRGLGFGSRPLTLWFVGFQFRLGVVIFFILLVASAVFHPVDVSLGLFVYFFLSLLSIALARLDEMGSDLRYGPRWAVTLLSGVVLVLFLGLALLQVFTLDAVGWLLRLLTPLWILVQIVLLAILIPVSYLAALLVELLSPIFAGLSRVLQSFSRVIPPNTFGEINSLFQDNPAFQYLAPVLKTAAVLVVILGIGYLLARALNRRLLQVEEYAYEREALESEDETARARRAFMPKKKPARRNAGHIAAETIRRIYAAMTARAEQAGLPRRVAETPYEFSPRLSTVWQSQTEEIQAITDAYVAVHYAEQEPTSEEVGRIRTAWKRLEERINVSTKST